MDYFIVFSCNCLYLICLINKLFNFHHFTPGFCNYLLCESKTRKHLIWLLHANCALTSYNCKFRTPEKKYRNSNWMQSNQNTLFVACFSPCYTITLQNYFWCSPFSAFHNNIYIHSVLGICVVLEWSVRFFVRSCVI